MNFMKEKLNQPVLISITPGTIVKTIFILLGFYVLVLIRDLILILLTSIVIASAIEPATRFLIKRKLPRVFAVVAVYLGIAVFLIGMFYVFLPPLLADLSDLADKLPVYVESLSVNQFGDIPGIGNLLGGFYESLSAGEIVSNISNTFSGATFGFLTTATSIFGGIMSFFLIIVISFYLAVQEDGIVNFIKIITPIKHEPYALDLWHRSQKKIGLWMQGQLLLAVIVGLITYLGLSILGVSNPMFLALITALFELIPIFGAILAAVPAVAFGLIDGGPTLGLIVLGLYLIIQQFESQLIHPLVVKKIVGIPALVAILSLIVGANIAGFLGILIAVPVAAAFMEFLGDVEKKKSKEMKELESKR
jgi:predicted PurR-regulated permease PerM